MSDSTPEKKMPASNGNRPLWYNPLTIGGFFIALTAFVLLFMFALFSMVTRTPNPYVDIIGYLVIPTIMGGGLFLMPLGIFLKSWWLKRRYPDEHIVFRFPHINLNNPKQWKVVKYIIVFLVVLTPTVAITSYHGYHYTDSSAFCSQACHQVMEPQATSYENSAHARVACAECHIGAGASWFVKSKLSGTRQIFATLGDSFPRPIPPAITELRPARETCEHCHWPKKFYGAKLREIVNFASDESNTKREINMLLKIGGGDETTGRAEGIHMHMALANSIEYIATDEHLQIIPWVKMIDPAGNEVIYRSDGRPSSDPKPEGIVRSFDCMDCHNRPAHKFRSPQESLDIYLKIGRIDPRLPFIKAQASRVLTQSYPDGKTAEAQIGITLTDFYQKNYAEEFNSFKAPLYQAIDAIREIYRRNFFPDMKVDWKTYPDNIGHMNSPGCFRCHEGKHVNQSGEPLSFECNTCHDFLNPVRQEGKHAVIEKGEFIHPFEMPAQHEGLQCYQCHNGGKNPKPTCVGCHQEQSDFIQGTSEDFKEFKIEADIMADMVSCQDCHQLSQGIGWENTIQTCRDCHEDEDSETWKKEAETLLLKAKKQTGEKDLEVLELLQKAEPLHNLEATRKIIKKLLSEESAEPSLE